MNVDLVLAVPIGRRHWRIFPIRRRLFSFRTSPNYDQAFYDAFRKRMESDRQRFTSHSHYYASPNSSQENYFGAASIILIIIGFGMFIHALQWR